jgi:hypothetical protein
MELLYQLSYNGTGYRIFEIKELFNKAIAKAPFYSRHFLDEVFSLPESHCSNRDGSAL